MESLEIEEPELADEIRKKMFVFEDILLLDDRAIQRVLRGNISLLIQIRQRSRHLRLWRLQFLLNPPAFE